MSGNCILPRRRFRMIVFDWDGTAVRSRHDSVDHLLWRAEALLRRGVWLIVLTGTNFDNLDRQFFSKVRPHLKGRLLACVNRGSEVYGFDESGTPVLRHARIATDDENESMDMAGELASRYLADTYGLETRIVSDRMNRRKLDIIPAPKWQDPQKESIGELLQAVEVRLTDAGIPGIGYVLDLVHRCCIEAGLDVRITTDVKHVEFGLTDKSDSVRYILDEVAQSEGIAINDILFVGDEFGPIGGFDGSDYKMLVPEARDAVYVSVGREPNGVPEGVLHVGGGVPSFVGILDEQRKLWRPERDRDADAADDLVYPDDNGWSAAERRCDERTAMAYETIFTIANGYMGTRGSHEDGLFPGRPATFVAGLFDQAPGQVTELVSLPDWLPVRLSLDGDDVAAACRESAGGSSSCDGRGGGGMCDYSRSLDMASGVLKRAYRYRGGDGRVLKVESERFASIASPHTMHMRYSVTMESGSGTVALCSILDGQVAGSGVVHLSIDSVNASDDGESHICATTLNSGIPAVLWCSTRVCSVNADRLAPASAFTDGSGAWIDYEARLAEGQSIVLEKHVAVYTGRDIEASSKRPPGAAGAARSASGHTVEEELLSRARTAACSAAEAGYADALSRHASLWAERWARCDVQVDGPDFDQMGIRFAIFHTLACASETDQTVSVAAKGLHGPGYKGHVFWDTEIFVFPFFVMSFPEIARNLLMYRYNTLPGARRKAAAGGYRGAMYAWESADTGDETTPRWSNPHPVTGERTRIWCGDTEDHVTADIAYATMSYWRVTGDHEFMKEFGAEIVIEAARFWTARAHWNAGAGRYEYLRVIGPDEYHENIDNNAFTNYMAQWTITKGLEVADWMRVVHPAEWDGLAGRIGLTQDELAEMERVRGLVYLPRPDVSTGVIEQFDGYYGYEYVDLATLDTGGRSVEAVIGHEAVTKSSLLKQADVLMLGRLLPGLFSRRVWEANWDFYEPRTAHGSSLSPSVHAALACRLGSPERAYTYLQHAMALDLADHMGNVDDGIHSANLGGIWQAVVFGFAGVCPGDESEPCEDGGLVCRCDCGSRVLRVAPRLPEQWDRIEFPLMAKGCRIRIIATHDRAAVTCING